MGTMGNMSGTKRASDIRPKPNPYEVNPYARPAGRGHAKRVAGCVLTLVAMATLCFGVIYLLWKAAGR